jgi:hypothetical protein
VFVEFVNFKEEFLVGWQKLRGDGHACKPHIAVDARTSGPSSPIVKVQILRPTPNFRVVLLNGSDLP